MKELYSYSLGRKSFNMTNKFYCMIQYFKDCQLNLSFFVPIKEYVIGHRIIRVHQWKYNFPVAFEAQWTSLQFLKRGDTL